MRFRQRLSILSHDVDRNPIFPGRQGFDWARKLNRIFGSFRFRGVESFSRLIGERRHHLGSLQSLFADAQTYLSRQRRFSGDKTAGAARV